MSEELRHRIGDYEILGTLGAGGMGKVYRVRNLISDRVEAMKILLPSLSDHRDMAERFMREIKLVASLHHPNIANLCTAQMLENHLVMVMEFVEGDTFSDLLDERAVPLEYALGYFDQALSALGYAHGKGIIHRDIKPSNIMLTPEGTVKLMDFGIARNNADRALTQTGATIGTVSYMSPEQIAGRPTDARSDLYSMGILLYETITGEQPFKGTSDYELMTAHMNQTPRPPVDRVPGTPAELNNIILKLLAKTPEERFQSAEETRQALRSVPGFADTKRGLPTRPLKRAPQAIEGVRDPAAPPRREATVVERLPQAGVGPGAARMPTMLEPQFPATLARDAYTERRITEVAPIPTLAPAGASAIAVRKTGFARHPALYAGAGLVLVAGAAAVPLLHSRAGGKGEEKTSSAAPAVAPAARPPAPAGPAAAGVAATPASAGAGKVLASAGGGGAGLPPPAGPGAAFARGGNGRMPTVPGRFTPPNSPAAAGHLQPAARPGNGSPVLVAGKVSFAAAPGGTAAPPANSSPTPPALSPETKARLDSEETEIDQLDSRAVGINNSLNTMKRSMESQGVTMRGDIATKQASMNLNLAKAKQALASRDPDRTQRFTTQAQSDAGDLEKFLGR